MVKLPLISLKNSICQCLRYFGLPQRICSSSPTQIRPFNSLWFVLHQPQKISYCDLNWIPKWKGRMPIYRHWMSQIGVSLHWGRLEANLIFGGKNSKFKIQFYHIYFMFSIQLGIHIYIYHFLYIWRAKTWLWRLTIATKIQHSLLAREVFIMTFPDVLLLNKKFSILIMKTNHSFKNSTLPLS